MSLFGTWGSVVCPGGLFFSHYTYAYGGLGDLELRAFGVYFSFTTKTTFLCNLAYGLNSLPPLWLRHLGLLTTIQYSL